MVWQLRWGRFRVRCEGHPALSGAVGKVSQNGKELARRIRLESGGMLQAWKTRMQQGRSYVRADAARLLSEDGIELGRRGNKSWRVSGPVDRDLPSTLCSQFNYFWSKRDGDTVDKYPGTIGKSQNCPAQMREEVTWLTSQVIRSLEFILGASLRRVLSREEAVSQLGNLILTPMRRTACWKGRSGRDHSSS